MDISDLFELLFGLSGRYHLLNFEIATTFDETERPAFPFLFFGTWDGRQIDTLLYSYGTHSFGRVINTISTFVILFDLQDHSRLILRLSWR
jgi:hypothetical protein